MGYIVERANIVDRPVFRPSTSAAKNIPGSMGVAALITCALFATATGIVGRGGDADGAAGTAGHAAGALRHELCQRHHLRWRHAGHPHPPPSIMLIVYAASSGRLDRAALCGSACFPACCSWGLYLVYVVGSRDSSSRAWRRSRPRREVPDVPFLKLAWMLATFLLPARLS